MYASVSERHDKEKLDNLTVKNTDYNIKKRIDWIGALLIGRCNMRGIYFVFSPPTQRKSKPTVQNNTFANPGKPGLETKVCKSAVYFIILDEILLVSRQFNYAT